MVFLKPEFIESEALGLLYEYEKNIDPISAPPVPVAEIFESHLGFSLQFSDLRKKYGDDKVLAEIYILSKKVIVDESLEPEEHPQAEGRFNFTLAHEIGHWILHRHNVIAVADIPDLFGVTPPPVICRDFSKEPHEWQADEFAAYLLMPKEFVLEEWKRISPEGSRNVYAEVQDKRSRFRMSSDEKDPICDIVRQTAPVFHVSLQAMQRKLRHLHLLDFNKPERTLFDI